VRQRVTRIFCGCKAGAIGGHWRGSRKRGSISIVYFGLTLWWRTIPRRRPFFNSVIEQLVRLARRPCRSLIYMRRELHRKWLERSIGVCTETLVRIDLMKESLNVGQDGRADISLRDTQPREVRSQTTFSCTHGPLPFSQGSCSCRLCGRSAGPNGGGRQDLTFHHSLRSDSPI
jgi:hypothetical protein